MTEKYKHIENKQIVDVLNQELRRLHGLIENEDYSIGPQFLSEIMRQKKVIQEHLIAISKKNQEL